MASTYNNLLQTYFDMSYVLFFAPFRFISGNYPKSTFYISKWLPQQIFCAIFSASGYLMDMYHYRLFYVKAKKQMFRDPVLYFGFLAIIFSSALHISCHKLFWCSAMKLTKIISFLQSQFLDVPISITSLSKFKCRIITIALTIPMWYQITFLIFSFFDSNQTSNLVQLARKLYFFVNFSNRSKNLNNMIAIGYTSLEYALVALVNVACIVKRISATLIGLGILYPVLILWLTSKAFRQKLKYPIVQTDDLVAYKQTKRYLQLSHVFFLMKSNTRDQYYSKQWSELWKSYQAIQELSHLISGAYGTMLTWYLAQFIMSLARNTDKLIFTKGLQGKLDMLEFLVTNIAILLLSAETVVNVSTSKKSVYMD